MEIKPQTVDLICQLTRLTGESPIEAVHYAVLERLQQIQESLQPAASPEDRGINAITGFASLP
jgi:hypothetical protein